MFSFDKYKKRYFLQFFLDIGLTCLAVGWIVFCRLKQFNTEYIFWVLGSLAVLGLLRLAVLINWLIKAIAIRNVRLSLFSGFHLIVLGVCLWWALFLGMIFSGIIGITPDGTENGH